MLVADSSSKTRGQGNWNRVNEAPSDMEVIACSVLCSAWGIWGIWDDLGMDLLGRGGLGHRNGVIEAN